MSAKKYTIILRLGGTLSAAYRVNNYSVIGVVILHNNYYTYILDYFEKGAQNVTALSIIGNGVVKLSGFPTADAR